MPEIAWRLIIANGVLKKTGIDGCPILVYSEPGSTPASVITQRGIPGEYLQKIRKDV